MKKKLFFFFKKFLDNSSNRRKYIRSCSVLNTNCFHRFRVQMNWYEVEKCSIHTSNSRLASLVDYIQYIHERLIEKSASPNGNGTGTEHTTHSRRTNERTNERERVRVNQPHAVQLALSQTLRIKTHESLEQRCRRDFKSNSSSLDCCVCCFCFFFRIHLHCRFSSMNFHPNS